MKDEALRKWQLHRNKLVSGWCAYANDECVAED
jgi:hypothetical protein